MLTGKQRRYLRALGTGIDPVIHIGKSGYGEFINNQLNEALEARELVKVRVIPNSSELPREIAPQLAKDANAELVQVIGRNMLFYRRSLNKPSIELPN